MLLDILSSACVHVFVVLSFVGGVGPLDLFNFFREGGITVEDDVNAAVGLGGDPVNTFLLSDSLIALILPPVGDVEVDVVGEAG